MPGLKKLAAEIEALANKVAMDPQDKAAFEKAYATQKEAIDGVIKAVEHADKTLSNSMSPGVKLWFAKALKSIVDPMMLGKKPNAQAAFKYIDEHRKTTLED